MYAYINYSIQMPTPTQLRRTSQSRLTLVRLRDEVAQLIELFLAREPLVPGTVYELRRKCGHPTCRCARGEPHASWVLSWSEGGRTRLRIVPKEKLRELRILTQRYSRLRKARARLVKIHRGILALIDELERARRKEL